MHILITPSYLHIYLDSTYHQCRVGNNPHKAISTRFHYNHNQCTISKSQQQQSLLHTHSFSWLSQSILHTHSLSWLSPGRSSGLFPLLLGIGNRSNHGYFERNYGDRHSDNDFGSDEGIPLSQTVRRWHHFSLREF